MTTPPADHIAAMFIGKKELLTADELAHILRPRPKTLYSLAGKGKIPYVRIEGMILFPTKQIIDWLRERNYRPSPSRNGGSNPVH
jgi:hypothetical protein